MKKRFAFTLIPFALLAISACGYQDIQTGHSVVPGSLVPTDHKIKVGILQPVEHAALGMSRQGFVDALKEAGYINGKNISLDYRNAGGNDASLQSAAKSLAGGCEINLGIGTGAAQALQAAEINAGSDNPLLFTAVTDPVAAGLVKNVEEPESFVTGTSDMNPVEAQVELIKECLPSVEKIKMGILYTQSEVNSKVQSDLAQAEATKQGFDVEIATATNSSDIKTAAEKLAQTCQAIYIPTDNNIAANMNAVKTAADSYHVLIVTGEEGMLGSGGQITLSIDYYELGKATGKMAVELISGKKTVKEIPIQYMSATECTYVCHSGNLKDAGITLPETVMSKFEDKAA